MAAYNDIILFHYPYSPYARRILWYLTLRGIKFAECVQPPYLPREDLNTLGVKYRRIPVLSIGRDIFCDSRLIIQKLEERFPSGALGASKPDQKAIETLLEDWIIDGGVFARASQLLPLNLPLVKNPTFIRDREDYSGRAFSKSEFSKAQPEALAYIRGAFGSLEVGLLADGRSWILGTEKPSLADIKTIWIFHWLVELPGALPSSLISSQQFPKVFAWIERFDKAVTLAKSSVPKPITLRGAEAIRQITQADFTEHEGHVDTNDPIGLKKGQDVESWPIDTGSNHHDRGRLVALSLKEVVIATASKVRGKEVHIHHPRTNFRVQAVTEAGVKL